ncbi:phosphatidylglycerophosphate phosphatase 1, chloroplastic [Phoenix dactylifera]|uniref:Phosphatidylglycerophosphate phosphatase 1, chloroplastic n=1 Tax=Phoenix dactylifera TaxID=42345 RepID=A0A8B7C1J1_PHODC|nr:phosphatidylglycerophosphate phosphatase 1, chloroplastic [Phoenix dactylifera]
MSRISPSPSLPLLSHHHFVPLFVRCRWRTSAPAEELDADEKRSVPMTNWWQRALGQRLNSAGVGSFASVVAREPHLALPHIAVPDIRWIDWTEMERLGFRGVVFDKDNTLTAPYSLSLWPPLSHSLHLCRSAFPGKIAIFSNSAGLRQFDQDGSEARALEESIGGIHVIRHEIKKPSGTAEDIEKYFGCSASLLVMVGDRHFTDVVYGNKHGFLTILTEPLSLSEEPFIVKQVRKLENILVKRWYQQGLRPPKHGLLSEANQCIKVPSL